jgi:tetratricopeptide (TPR) repeat protein
MQPRDVERCPMRIHRHSRWYVRLDRFAGDARLRRRVGALAGTAFVFVGVLIAIGLGRIVLILLIGGALAGAFAVMIRSFQAQDLLRFVQRPGSATAGRRLATLGARAETLGKQAVAAVKRERLTRSPTSWPQRPAPTAAPTEVYGWPYAGSTDEVPAAAAPARPKPRVDEERRRAVEANARGTQLRRAGTVSQAVALHLEALEIFQRLDDRHAQASTLNSLALALAASGDGEAAVERFEESLAILREGGGEPEEGKVIANLAFTLLKQGAGDRGRELLGEALEKLPPESPAAQRVEAQLRRAS